MKLKTLLITILVVTPSILFAADGKTLAKIDIPKLNEKSSSENFEDNVQNLDTQVQKMFKEAEKFYKAAKEWKAVKCTPKTGFICSKWECPPHKVNTFIFLNKEAGTIKRCTNAEYCEEFFAEFTQNGVFFNIQSDGPVGTLIRVLGDSRYKEISTVGLDAYIANGECVRITPKEADDYGKEELERRVKLAEEAQKELEEMQEKKKTKWFFGLF